jgi:hypothetical protein
VTDLLDRFRHFRRTRPFWAGLFTIAGGIEILLLPLSPVADMVLLGVAGMSGALIGVLLVVTGLFVWFSPPNRTLSGVLTLVFSLASFVVSNLGGLIVGMVLGLVGGALTLAWTPDRSQRGGRRRRDGRPGSGGGNGAGSGGRGGAGGGGDGPSTGGTAAVVLLLLVALALPLATPGQAQASPSITPPPIPPPIPPPFAPPAISAIPQPLPGGPYSGTLLPPVLPGLTNLLPAALFAPFQPTVAPERNAVASGLVGELLMDTLTVTNFRYQGIVDFPVAGGGRQRALRIVVDSTDIGNLRINIPGKEASVQVRQRSGARHANTTRLILDCTRLRVTIAGLLTIEFSLDFPPPPLILIPFLAATDVQIDYVRLSTPTLVIPGLSAKGAGPAGKRVGLSGTGKSGSGSGQPGIRAGQPLTPDQAGQLAQMAALLNRPQLMAPYGSNRL